MGADSTSFSKMEEAAVGYQLLPHGLGRGEMSQRYFTERYTALRRLRPLLIGFACAVVPPLLCLFRWPTVAIVVLVAVAIAVLIALAWCAIVLLGG